MIWALSIQIKSKKKNVENENRNAFYVQQEILMSRTRRRIGRETGQEQGRFNRGTGTRRLKCK